MLEATIFTLAGVGVTIAPLWRQHDISLQSRMLAELNPL
jgi:hypothetical protein